MLYRRDAMLRLGSIGAGALALPQLLSADQTPETKAPETKHGRKTCSCIFLFMWGGQPQQDMWDMKPHAPDGVRSLFAPIQTNVPGLVFSDQMPQIAKHADKLAIVRSLQHTNADHQISVYHCLTGRPMVPPRSFPGNARRRTDYPNVGSIFSYLGGASDLPASFAIPRPVGHDGLRYAGTYGGMLGSTHDPVELGQVYNHVETGERVASGDPLPLTLPDDLSITRMQARRGLLGTLEDTDRQLQRSSVGSSFSSTYESAYRLISSPAVKKALDLSEESPATRDRYGRNEYGESFLTSRRLIEAGIRLVTVNWMFITPRGKVYNVWDAHGGLGDLEHGATGYGMLKANYCMPSFDQAFSALLEDLTERGLLDDTVIACVGEFGRTPQINGSTGRDHWPFCYSAVLAGGPVQGGAIFGASDRKAAYVTEEPVTPGDYMATIVQACGLDPHREFHDLTGRPYQICDGRPITQILS